MTLSVTKCIYVHSFVISFPAPFFSMEKMRFSFEKKKIDFSFAYRPNGFQEKTIYSDTYHSRYVKRKNFPNPKISSQILAGEEISTQTINKMSSIKLNINKTESIINSQFGRNL